MSFISRHDYKNQKTNSKKYGPSLTQQCFKDECDINEIVKRPNMGINPFNRPTVQAQYGDFSQLKDFHTAQNIVCQAKSNFEALPSKVRDRFHNNVNEFVSFVNEGEKNIEEGVRLGIYEKSALKHLSSQKTAEKAEQAVSQPIPSTSAESSAQ